MTQKLTDTELLKVCNVISTSMGFHFPVERWDLLRRNLASAAGELGFQDNNEFIQCLLSSSVNNDHLKILAAHLTISETYFWREPNVFAALTDLVLPELIDARRKSGKHIRIWSAGCSTGEEPYSLAIALHKTIQKPQDWNITILATDINPESLYKARNGMYGKWSFRNSPEWLKKRYFHQNGNSQVEIIPEIKKMVDFSCHNLVAMSAVDNTGFMDIIFCRNVLMYFTPEWAARIAQNLTNSLSEEGWLVVSSSELSSQLFPDLTPVDFPGAVLYQKTKKRNSFKIHSNVISEKDVYIFSSESPFHPLTPSPLHPISPSPLSSGFNGRSRLHQTKSAASFDLNAETKELAKEYPQAAAKAPEESYADRIQIIRSLADRGYLAEALLNCEKAISSEKLSPGLYFLQASILQEMDRNREATESLKKAIYVHPEYIIGHFTLGNLFFRQGKIKNAIRHFDIVSDLINKLPGDCILPESEGLSANYIRDIITNLRTQLNK